MSLGRGFFDRLLVELRRVWRLGTYRLVWICRSSISSYWISNWRAGKDLDSWPRKFIALLFSHLRTLPYPNPSSGSYLIDCVWWLVGMHFRRGVKTPQPRQANESISVSHNSCSLSAWVVMTCSKAGILRDDMTHQLRVHGVFGK